MAKTPRREKFDPGREFIVVKGFKCNGKDCGPGSLFDKHQVTTRRLRQMFDRRLIDMTPGDPEPDDAVIKPDFATMPKQAIVDWLQSNGVVPRATWTFERLVIKASDKWDALHAQAANGHDTKPKKSLPGDWNDLPWGEVQERVRDLTGIWPRSKARATELINEHNLA